MAMPLLVQGRLIGHVELEQVRGLLRDHPDWSRYRLSRHLAQSWDWRNAVGQLKDMAARTLLLKLEQHGWIELPLRCCVSPNRMRHKRMPAVTLAVPPSLAGPLSELIPLHLCELSHLPEQRRLFEALLHQHHYLSYRSPVGENLKYLARDRQGRPVACALFGAAAWKCAVRDQYIGWDSHHRAAGLSRVANNSRFLILPWVKVPQLASHLLSQLSRQLSADWQRKYGHPVDLVETFVEVPRFSGVCYRAANWIGVGQTQGRTRQDRQRLLQAPLKEVYLYPLQRDFRRRLCQGPGNPP